MTLYDLKIIQALNESGRDSPRSSITISATKDILPEQSRKSRITTSRHIDRLVTEGHLSRSFADGLAATYYITDQGKEFLQSVY